MKAVLKKLTTDLFSQKHLKRIWLIPALQSQAPQSLNLRVVGTDLWVTQSDPPDTNVVVPACAVLGFVKSRSL